MSQPFKPLIDAGVDPEKIVAAAGVDSQGGFWTVKATTELDGVAIGMAAVAISLPAAVAQCLSQLNEAKGIYIEIVTE